MTPRRANSGFTLIELVTVLVLIGALAAVASIFIVDPFRAVEDMRRRAELVDEAQIALEQMAREIRSALPNSVRVDTNGTRTAVETVSTRTGGRYRRLPAAGGGGDTLNRTQSSDSFDVLGGLPDAGAVDASGAPGIDCASGNGDCLNVFNTGQTLHDVYAGDNIAKVVAVTANSLQYDNGGGMPAFRQHSPQQRFFVIDDVVSFICDTGSGQLTRQAGYGLSAAQSLTPGGSVATLARDVSACAFTYDPGSSTRSGLVTLDITLSRGGEDVRLLQQIHVVNAP